MSEEEVIGFCAVGWIHQAAATDGVITWKRDTKAEALANAGVEALTVHLQRSVPGWNDVNGRKKEEVRDAMLLAAKDIRNNNPAK